MTTPDVFIIESLTFGDETKQRLEGQILSSILKLSGKKCKYFYIRTKRELEEILGKFTDSDYRYLHMSCHGSDEELCMTLDDIPFDELGEMIRPHLHNRRLFLSSCFAANRTLARVIMKDSDCLSILGPKYELFFDRAAIFWASFYYAMFNADKKVMRNAVVLQKAQEVSNMFQVDLNFIQRDNDKLSGYSMKSLTPCKEAE